jgi:hypothetical protein
MLVAVVDRVIQAQGEAQQIQEPAVLAAELV